MSFSQKLLFASVLAIVVLLIVRFEEKDVLPTNIGKMIRSSEDIVFLQSAVQRILGEEEQIPVSTSTYVQNISTYRTAKPYEDGFLLMYEELTAIDAWQDGYIVFTGYTKKTGKTMRVYYDDIVVTYGFLEKFYHLPYTPLDAGELLAVKALDKPLYLKIEKDGQVLTIEEINQLFKEWQLP